MAQVRGRQNDNASGPLCLGAMAFRATARPRGCFVQAALTRAFATVAGAFTHFRNDEFPVRRINSSSFHRVTPFIFQGAAFAMCSGKRIR